MASFHDSKNIIGAGSRFEGRLRVNGNLRIDGKYESTALEAEAVTIGRQGRVKTKIKAGTVVVEGVFIGAIKASIRVILLPTARIHGDISTPEMIIQNGVVWEGSCRISGGDDAPDLKTIEALFDDDPK